MGVRRIEDTFRIQGYAMIVEFSKWFTIQNSDAPFIGKNIRNGRKIWLK
jgi:hypothetical protein